MANETLIMFDLDGTMWDSAEGVAESWNEIFREADPTLPALTADDVHRVMGMTMKEISEVLQPAMNPAVREEVFERCCRHEVDYLYDHPGRLYPGLQETLDALREAGYDLAVVSNCQRGYVEAFLHSSGLGDRFIDYEEWERTGLSKGENIRLVMERNGYRRAVYIGDTAKDQEAAKAAGIPFIHAAYGFGKTVEPEGVIRDITELPEAVRRLDHKKQD
jgi:phosphoglycolate phosphatase